MAVVARDTEERLLSRCASVAKNKAAAAQDKVEANVFRVAALVVQSNYPGESERLMRVSDEYFSQHPDERLPAAEVVRSGWVFSLPRLRDMLRLRLQQGKQNA